MTSTIVRSLIQSLLLAGLVLMMLAAPILAQQQSSHDHGTPAESKQGTSGASSYAQDKVETVNLVNGNLSINLPLVTIGGRGSASYTVSLTYNSKVWSEGMQTDPGFNDPFGNATPPFNHYYAIYDDPTDPNRGLGGGWRLETSPKLKTRVVNIDPLPRQTCSSSVQVEGGAPCGYKYILTRMWIILPDGSEVEMRDSLTEGAPVLTPEDNNTHYHRQLDRDRGRIWHSTDGSNVTLVLDNGQSDPNLLSERNVLVAGWIFLSDGTRIRIQAGRGNKIIDKDGNYLLIESSTEGTTYTDQLGRQVLVSNDTSGIVVTMKRYDGVPDRKVYIDYGVIGEGDNLRAEFRNTAQWPRPFITGDYQRTRDQADLEHSLNTPHTDLFPLSEGLRVDQYKVDERSVVTGVRLMDGRSFHFRYNPWGEVAEIVYPGGGVSQIDYNGGDSALCGGESPFSGIANRRASERRILTDGSNVDATWEYPLLASTVETLEAYKGNHPRGSSGGELLLSETHYFMAVNAEFTLCTQGGPNGTGYEKWENAKENKVVRQTGSGTQTTVREWQQRAPVVWGNDIGLGYNAYAAQYGGTQQFVGAQQSPNDSRVAWEETTLENGKKTRVEYGYDDFNNVTSIKEYDFGNTNGSIGDPLRQTLRTYASSVNGYCYTNLNGLDGMCGSALSGDVNTIIHQRRLLLTETIKDGNGNVESFARLDYDNYPETIFTGTNPTAIDTNANMIQYDGSRFTQFNPSMQPRGNVTKRSAWIEGGTYTETPTPNVSNGTFAVSYSHYDNAGNVVAVKDPLNHISTVSYADNFGDGSNPDSGTAGPNGATYAFATRATNALGHESKTQYSYTLGAATASKDPNGVVSKMEYDNLGRAVRATAAAGLAEQSVSEMSYPTAEANEATASKQLDATRWLASKTIFDGFDRPVLSESAEDGQHANFANFTIFSKTIYDALGRVKMATNPYRAQAAATDGWKRNSYDLAGRVTEVASFSGAAGNAPPETGTNANWTGSVTTSYASEQVTVRDQAAKQRRSTTDGIGRLKSVDEMLEYPSTSIYATTNYNYDARGNLKTVNQGQQTRSFAYDGMSRLKSATNPEVCQQQGGTCIPVPITYEYELNGNLKKKTDARSIVSTYTYDELDRVKTRTYSDETPVVTYTYDAAGVAYAKGRLTSVTSSVSTTSYGGYDALGRVTSSTQVTDAQSYQMSYRYNLAGGLKSQTYPSGRIVKTEYDEAGRLAGVRNEATGLYYAGAAADTNNRFQYTASGVVTVMKLGNNLWEHTNFNSRLQPTQIDLGTASTNANMLQLDYSYGTANNNGNVHSQAISISGTPTFTQTYTYDAVNRLDIARETKTADSTQTWQQRFSYDVYGNRSFNTAETTDNVRGPQLGFNLADNRITTANYTYDFSGNIINDPQHAYQYDAENRMVANDGGANQSSGIPSSYYYDGDGKRVKKVAGLITTVFVYNMIGQLVAEYSNQVSGSGTSYLTNDNLGTPRVVTDINGVVKSRHDYLPFGEEVAAGFGGRVTAQGYGQLDGNRKKWAKLERDDETGLDYAQARYYSSVQGRFTSPDEFSGGPDDLHDFVDIATANPTFYAELRNPQSLNKYTYTYNNPLRYVDPEGHEADDTDQEGQSCSCPPPPPSLEDIKRSVGQAVDSAKTAIIIDAIPKIAFVTALTHIIGNAIGVYPTIAPQQVQPQTGTPPQQQSQPLPPPPPIQARGDRDQRKVNQGRADAAKSKADAARAERDRLRSTPNKTPEVKEALKKAEAELRKQLDRMRKSETHGKKGKGN